MRPQDIRMASFPRSVSSIFVLRIEYCSWMNQRSVGRHEVQIRASQGRICPESIRPSIGATGRAKLLQSRSYELHAAIFERRLRVELVRCKKIPDFVYLAN